MLESKPNWLRRVKFNSGDIFDRQWNECNSHQIFNHKLRENRMWVYMRKERKASILEINIIIWWCVHYHSVLTIALVCASLVFTHHHSIGLFCSMNFVLSPLIGFCELLQLISMTIPYSHKLPILKELRGGEFSFKSDIVQVAQVEHSNWIAFGNVNEHQNSGFLKMWWKLWKFIAQKQQQRACSTHNRSEKSHFIPVMEIIIVIQFDMIQFYVQRL